MTTYREAGVDIAAGQRAVELMKSAVADTYGPQVLHGIGAFGGLFDISALTALTAPVLVASTDSVGTKTRVAVAMQRYDTIGHDIVNHCLNDIVVQGARPLVFLDYFATSRLDPVIVAEVVRGCAVACKRAGCALLGGETAELPGIYAENEFDLVGTIVGVVDREQIIDGHTIKPGDVILGLASSGLHTNGYSLARHVFQDWDWRAPVPALKNRRLGDVLLTPHRSYLEEVQALQAGGVTIKGLAHITGGGLVDNLPRILPAGTAAQIQWGTWPVPPIFHLIQEQGDIDDREMRHTFNMGLGMLVVVAQAEAGPALDLLADQAWVVGQIIPSAEDPTVLFVESPR